MIIGVSGSSGSGKSFIVHYIKKKLPKNTVSIIFQDNYYKLREDQSKDKNENYNFDLPSSFHNNDFINDIKSLKAGNTIRRKEYNFNNPLVKPKFITVKHRPLIIVEGLFIFNDKKISENFDRKIFIDCEIKKMIKRRIKRDSEQRGYDKADVQRILFPDLSIDVWDNQKALELTLKLTKDQVFYNEVSAKAKEIYKTEFSKEKMFEILKEKL